MPRNARRAAVLAVVVACAPALADEPLVVNGELVFPEGAAIPRSLTATEAAYLKLNPLTVTPRAVTPPPTGPVHCASEYEPMDGLVMSWSGTASWQAILAEMAAHVTNAGNANIYMVCPSAGAQASAQSSLTAAGANMSRVQFIVRLIDSIWVRDYGPRYIFQGDCRAIVDHTYNRPRPNDNAMNAYFAQVRRHALYELGLVHGGGNYHLDSLAKGYTTRLINNENPSLTEAQIHGIWQSYQNVDTTFFTPFPTSVDATQHIDMWMQVLGDDRVMISDWPYNVGSTQDNICDAAAATMASRGFQVFRVPARSLSGVHYTYTNVVMCNGIVLVPTYTNTGMTSAPGGVNLNTEAVNAWNTALAGTGRTVVTVNCQNIVSAAGVMHCIVMHMPRHRGAPGVNGLAPTSYLKNLNGGEVLTPGAMQAIQWITDDDRLVVNADLMLSKDGGATWTAIASATPDSWTFNWTVPNVTSSQCRVRVVARDADGNTGFDGSDANFRINGTCTGDANGDGVRNFADLNTVLSQFGQSSSGSAGFLGGDVNGDGTVNFNDLNLVLSNFGQAC